MICKCGTEIMDRGLRGSDGFRVSVTIARDPEQEAIYSLHICQSCEWFIRDFLQAELSEMAKRLIEVKKP